MRRRRKQGGKSSWVFVGKIHEGKGNYIYELILLTRGYKGKQTKFAPRAKVGLTG